MVYILNLGKRIRVQKSKLKSLKVAKSDERCKCKFVNELGCLWDGESGDESGHDEGDGG